MYLWLHKMPTGFSLSPKAAGNRRAVAKLLAGPVPGFQSVSRGGSLTHLVVQKRHRPWSCAPGSPVAAPPSAECHPKVCHSALSCLSCGFLANWLAGLRPKRACLLRRPQGRRGTSRRIAAARSWTRRSQRLGVRAAYCSVRGFICSRFDTGFTSGHCKSYAPGGSWERFPSRTRFYGAWRRRPGLPLHMLLAPAGPPPPSAFARAWV